ncbi:hypothetical protein GPROT1_03130 [Gammaproteobacteria bacterium]|nr:hypothetical protein GPROT1_03130 [Gammaproteobacteria bacterium]
MDSYDRLFPSQDTMPRGGFGNLIAPPLQHGPRRDGNINDDLAAFPDEQQWAHLVSIQRIDTLTVKQIASDASRAGSVVGLRMAEVADEEDAAPWTRPPSGKVRSPRITGPLPNRVSAGFHFGKTGTAGRAGVPFAPSGATALIGRRIPVPELYVSPGNLGPSEPSHRVKATTWNVLENRS